MRTFRPKLIENEERIESITIRLSVKEKRMLLQKARDAGLTVSAYIRHTLIFEKPDFMQQVTENYVKSLQTEGLKRGVPIRLNSEQVTSK